MSFTSETAAVLCRNNKNVEDLFVLSRAFERIESHYRVDPSRAFETIKDYLNNNTSGSSLTAAQWREFYETLGPVVFPPPRSTAADLEDALNKHSACVVATPVPNNCPVCSIELKAALQSNQPVFAYIDGQPARRALLYKKCCRGCDCVVFLDGYEPAVEKNEERIRVMFPNADMEHPQWQLVSSQTIIDKKYLQRHAHELLIICCLFWVLLFCVLHSSIPVCVQ